MTLDDLVEQPKCHSCRKDAFFGAHQKNLNEDRPIDPYYQWQNVGRWLD